MSWAGEGEPRMHSYGQPRDRDQKAPRWSTASFVGVAWKHHHPKRSRWGQLMTILNAHPTHRNRTYVCTYVPYIFMPYIYISMQYTQSVSRKPIYLLAELRAFATKVSEFSFGAAMLICSRWSSWGTDVYKILQASFHFPKNGRPKWVLYGFCF